LAPANGKLFLKNSDPLLNVLCHFGCTYRHSGKKKVFPHNKSTILFPFWHW